MPHLPTELRDPEQLVDRGEPEQQYAPQPVGELDGRQRLEPERAAALGRHAMRGKRP